MSDTYEQLEEGFEKRLQAVAEDPEVTRLVSAVKATPQWAQFCQAIEERGFEAFIDVGTKAGA